MLKIKPNLIKIFNNRPANSISAFSPPHTHFAAIWCPIPQNPKTPSSFMLIDKSLILVFPHSLASLGHTTAHHGTPGHTRHVKKMPGPKKKS
jgi:hypothetical protein